MPKAFPFSPKQMSSTSVNKKPAKAPQPKPSAKLQALPNTNPNRSETPKAKSPAPKSQSDTSLNKKPAKAPQPKPSAKPQALPKTNPQGLELERSPPKRWKRGSLIGIPEAWETMNPPMPKSATKAAPHPSAAAPASAAAAAADLDMVGTRLAFAQWLERKLPSVFAEEPNEMP